MKKISLILSAVIITNIFIGCSTNKTISYTQPIELKVSNLQEKTDKQYIYSQIKDFMVKDFNDIDKHLSNIVYMNEEYRKLSNDEIDENYNIVKSKIPQIDNIIEITKNNKHLNKLFIDMKQDIINKMEEIKTANYYIHSGYGYKTQSVDAEGYIYHSIKVALIEDEFDTYCLDNWKNTWNIN